MTRLNYNLLNGFALEYFLFNRKFSLTNKSNICIEIQFLFIEYAYSGRKQRTHSVLHWDNGGETHKDRENMGS